MLASALFLAISPVMAVTSEARHSTDSHQVSIRMADELSKGGPPTHERRTFNIKAVFHEVESDRAGYRKYVGRTVGLTLHGTFVGEAADDAPPPAGAFSGIALRSSVLYFARDFTYSGRDGDSVLYVPNGHSLSPALLQR